MCENLLAGNAKTSSGSCSSVQLKLGSSIFEERVNGVKRKAGMLQHRWEAVYISCLEWQLRIEGNLRICKRLNRYIGFGKYIIRDAPDSDRRLNLALNPATKSGRGRIRPDLKKCRILAGAGAGAELRCIPNCYRYLWFNLAEYHADDSDDATDDTTDGNLDTFGSNNCLSMIEEEKDQDLQSDAADVNGVVADVLKKMKRHQLTHDGDVGYSSDGLQSPIDLRLHTSGLVRSSFDEGNRNVSKMKTNECNMGSDMSDSSGVGISATTGSCMSRSEAATNSDQLISGSVGSSGDSIGILVNKVFTNYDSSVPATEDEFSNDEVKNVVTSNDYSTIYSKSMDMLTCYEERNLKNLVRDGSVSDGEVLKSTDSNITKFHIPDTLTRWNKHKTRLHLNEESPGDASFESPSDKISLRKYKQKQAVFASPIKLARKRALNNNDNLSLSDGQLARKFKSEKSYHKIRKIMSFEGLNLNLRHYDVDENEEDEQLVVDLQQRTNNVQGSDQRVPDDELMSNTADEISSLQSEFELTDVEVEDTSFKSNVDIWLKDNIFDRYYYKVNKHSSTPKSHQSRIASRQLPFCDYLTESDSEAEEFKATLEDHNRAFTYTQQVVQDIADTWAANPQQTPDPNKLMEPLATCETSLMCLQDLKAALTRSNSACFFYEQQIKIVEGMLKKWSDLKMYICQRQQHACSLIYSETLKLEKDLSRSMLLLQMFDTKECAIMTEGLADGGDHGDDDEEDDDESGTALQILVETIKAYKAEKDHLFALKERFGQLLKRNCQPVSNKLCEKNYCDEGNVFEKIGKLNNICEISLEKATRTVMSLLSAVEPCNKFIELKRLITTSLDQSQQCLQSVDYENSGPALVQLLSSEMKGGWIDLRVKVSEMYQLNTSICQHVPMKKILKLIKSDLEKIDGRYKELQLQSSSVIEKLISNKCSSLGASVLSDNVNQQQHGPSIDESLVKERASDPNSTDRQTGVPTAVCSTPIQEGNSGVVKVMRNILKVGVPLSAAVLFLGWMYTYSSSGPCNSDCCLTSQQRVFNLFNWKWTMELSN
ncbi:hypothetical protein HELRODRAFT_189014 [Helobdella robusta]|uniref:KASH domain-containing protein n=1 Tax=Helobdella robusta TaxID=6412 RepID=T1FQK3_HELRO|nr:hypothetical protein HELRODRAFT_189014 [Helobdella robusta]ESN99163.1 hypothetical protein HELRODRAFT_189014 [Helobdella robusta]